MPFPLDIQRSRQADAFWIDPSKSMRYILLLGGQALPRAATVGELMDSERGPQLAYETLKERAPCVLPGSIGPVVVMLIL